MDDLVSGVEAQDLEVLLFLVADLTEVGECVDWARDRGFGAVVLAQGSS